MQKETQYTLCLFDLDGTLTDPKPGITKAYQYALSAFGIQEELERFVPFIGAPVRESIQDSFGLSDADTENAVARWQSYYAEKGLLENTVYPGILETLQSLADHGMTMAVATNKVSIFAEQILAYFHLDHFFTFVSGDEMDGSLSREGKQNIMRIAIQRLDPNRTMSAVMIGDRRHDIEGARAQGIDSIAALWGYGSRPELEAESPTHIAQTVGELYRIITGLGYASR